METKPTDSLSAYQRLGSAEGVAQLVALFYQVMDRDPSARAVRALHGASLEEAQSKLQDFLTGWLGGPPLYVMKYGHPRMRMRHMPFVIGEQEMQQWLYCMTKAMEELQLPIDLKSSLQTGFIALAEKIRNH